jgi:hypothetical protein
MAIDSTKPSWIEPPPQRSGMGCFGKGCLIAAGAGVLLVLLFVLGSYLFVSHGLVSTKPRPLPAKPLPPEELSHLEARLDEFKSTPPPPAPTPAVSTVPTETPTPGVSPSPERELTLSAADINGLIAANPKSRGHAFVSLSGNTAHVQLSIPSAKVPGVPKGYLNGSFIITTNGPTPISALQVSHMEANGYPMPSGILSTSFRGQSPLGYALQAASKYNVSTAEIRNGVVVLH